MNTRPAITGETENGKSISVIRICLPRKSNFAIAHAAAMPNNVFNGHHDRGRQQRESDRGKHVRLLQSTRDRRRCPFESA